MKKLLEKNETLMQIVNDARHPSTCPKGRMDISNNVCDYKVNRLTMKKLLEKNETLTQIVNDARRPSTCPKWRMDQPKAKFSPKNPTKTFFELVTKTHVCKKKNR